MTTVSSPIVEIVAGELSLFLDDRELHRRLAPHMGWDRFRATLRQCEREDFPRVNSLWRGRYWPAVKAWLDRENGLSNAAITGTQDGTEDFDAPRGDAPGLKVGRNSLKYWIARQVVRDPMGFPDPCIPLPADTDDVRIAQLCQDYTARLKAWIDEQKKIDLTDPVRTKTHYDGTVLTACRVYQEHPLSDFHSVKHNTRATYLSSLRLIERTVGKRLVHNLTVLGVKNWYRNWREPAEPGGRERIKRAHDGISMFRTVMWFMTSLRKPECKQLAEEMSAVKFEKGAAREQEIAYSQVIAFIRAANGMGQKGMIPAERALYMSIAVAAQFELMLRQADIIGQWAPLNPAPRLPKGASTLIEGSKIWSAFFTWELVPGWRWRMKTSKSRF